MVMCKLFKAVKIQIHYTILFSSSFFAKHYKIFEIFFLISFIASTIVLLQQCFTPYDNILNFANSFFFYFISFHRLFSLFVSVFLPSSISISICYIHIQIVFLQSFHRFSLHSWLWIVFLLHFFESYVRFIFCFFLFLLAFLQLNLSSKFSVELKCEIGSSIRYIEYIRTIIAIVLNLVIHSNDSRI